MAAIAGYPVILDLTLSIRSTPNDYILCNLYCNYQALVLHMSIGFRFFSVPYGDVTMTFIQKCFLAASLAVMAPFAAIAQVTSEHIYIVEENGRHALTYTTSRTDYASYSVWFKNKEGYKAEDYLKEFLYIFPNEYKWDTTSQRGYSLLRLPHSDFATMERVDLQREGALQVSKDGMYIFDNWVDQRKTPDGHYGVWNSPDNFSHIAYSWVFPDNLEPYEYESNRTGPWVLRHNTLTFYGMNVNDLVFTIKYRPRSHEAYKELKEKLADERQVKVEQRPSGVRITVEATLPYPSGVAELSEEGKRMLRKIVETLKARPLLDVVVEGHADIVPIGPKIIDKYPTNWELSSFRSINVIHFLVEEGIAESRFESRAFSNQRPVASNETEEGMARNRRIELMIVDKIE